MGRNKHIVIPPNPSSGGGGSSVDPASATPKDSLRKNVSVTAAVGTSAKLAREDHVHLTQDTPGACFGLSVSDPVLNAFPSTNFPLLKSVLYNSETNSVGNDGFIKTKHQGLYFVGATICFQAATAGNYDIWVLADDKIVCRAVGPIENVGNSKNNNIAISGALFMQADKKVMLAMKNTVDVQLKNVGTNLWAIKV